MYYANDDDEDDDDCINKIIKRQPFILFLQTPYLFNDTEAEQRGEVSLPNNYFFIA